MKTDKLTPIQINISNSEMIDWPVIEVGGKVSEPQKKLIILLQATKMHSTYVG